MKYYVISNLKMHQNVCVSSTMCGPDGWGTYSAHPDLEMD